MTFTSVRNFNIESQRKLVFFLVLAFFNLSAQAVPSGFGMIAYWGDEPSTYGGQIPQGAYVVVNPNSGALDMSQSQIENYKALIANVRSQGGKVLGYIPTGYAQQTQDEQNRYNAIPDNLNAYSKTLGGVDGFFFDEAAYDSATLQDPEKCSGTPPKWAAIRSTMASNGVSGTVVWNAGWPGSNGCFVTAAQSGEHVVIFETSYEEYIKNADYLDTTIQNQANAIGVKTWLLVHSSDQDNMKAILRRTTANYVYVTSVHYNPNLPWGGPIWNYTPTYWGNESQSGTERWCLKMLSSGGSCD